MPNTSADERRGIPVGINVLLTLVVLILSLVGVNQRVVSSSFELPQDGSTVVGRVRVLAPSSDNTLVDIARHFNLGHHEIIGANPGVNVWLPGVGVDVVVPGQFILPPKPWEGVVINIPQRRLFYFPEAEEGQAPQVMTFPVSIAREGWSTPLGLTQVIAKHKDPAWFVPSSIRKEKFEEGELDFPTYFPPGPNNPMGMLAIQIGFPGIFIHGTNRPWGVGMRVSHGCLHLYPEDAALLFPTIKAGTSVRVIDQPFLVGVLGDRLLMTSYKPISEYGETDSAFTRAVIALAPYIRQRSDENKLIYDVEWKKVDGLLENQQTVPLDILVGAESGREKIAGLMVELYDFPPYDIDANDARPPGEEPGQKD